MRIIDFFYLIIVFLHKNKLFFLEKYTFKFLKVVINISFSTLYKKKIPKFGEVSKKKNDYIIISFTTFPKRIDDVWKTAFTLLNQSIKPDRIILWLAKTEFKDISCLPKSLLRLMKFGLEIKFCDDLKSHKKYYYAMKEFPNAIIVTVDDDIFYPTNMLENLYLKHLEFPNVVCSNWAHEITFNAEGKINLYSEWNSAVEKHNKHPEEKLFPVGYQGVLYPPGSLDGIVFNKKLIKKMVLTTDDIWLKFAAEKRGTKAVKTDKENIKYFEIISSEKNSLFKINLGNNSKNDVSIKLITKYFYDKGVRCFEEC